MNKKFLISAIVVAVALVIGGFLLGAFLNGKPTQPTQPVQSQTPVGLATQPGDIVVTKVIDYDDITTTGVTAVNPVVGGFVIDNLIISTGASAIASGTAVTIGLSGGSYGTSTPVLSAQVSSLTKAQTIDLRSSSTYASTTQATVIGDGASLVIKCTVASCKTDYRDSGTTGYLRVTAVLKRLTNQSSITE